MASTSKTYGYDVGRGGDPAKPFRATYKGERRNEKTPRGRAERFVDLQGNVVTQQLISPGVPPTQEAIARARAQLHAAKNNNGSVVGFVEHGKCPLRHGVPFRNAVIEQEFADLPHDLKRPCAEDPPASRRTKDAAGNLTVHHADACPHIEWLIKSRIQRELERTASRRASRESALDIERKKLAAMEAQAEAAQKTNEKLLEMLATKPARKAAE